MSAQIQASLPAPVLRPWLALPFLQSHPSPPHVFPKGLRTWCSSSSCTSTWAKGKHEYEEQLETSTHSSLPTSNPAADGRTSQGRPFPHPQWNRTPNASISPLGPFPMTPRSPTPSHLGGFVAGSGLQESSDQVIQLCGRGEKGWEKVKKNKLFQKKLTAVALSSHLLSPQTQLPTGFDLGRCRRHPFP